MSDHSAIVWTDATWGPVTGCTRVSEGCDHCYIERTPPLRIAHRRFNGDGPGSTTGVLLHPERLDQPLRWRRPRRIFVNSMADLFHDTVPASYIARVFAVMALVPHHSFQILTKRPARMAALLASDAFAETFQQAWENEPGPDGAEPYAPPWPLPNVWLGVSVETQRWAEVRIPLLLRTPAAIRFLSCEPLLESVSLQGFLGNAPTGEHSLGRHGDGPLIDWVIAGGESGPGARPMSPRWARQLRDECVQAGVPFTFKQWGEWTDVEHGLDAAGDDDPLFRRCVANNRVNGHRLRYVEDQTMLRLGRHKTGRVLDGRTWDQHPGARHSHQEVTDD